MNMLNRSFFERDARAADLRRTCLMGTAAYEAVLMGDEESVGMILDVNQKLLASGIAPGMHIISDDDPDKEAKRQNIMDTPVIAAEFVCGQVLRHWQRVGLTTAPEMAVLAEHDQLLGQGEELLAFDPSSASEPVMDFMVKLGFVGMANSMLDSQAGY